MAKPSSRLHGDWGARTRSTVHDARRYARFVGIMKRVLLGVAGALVLAVLAYSLQPRGTRYAMTFGRLDHLANDLTMLKPRLTGSDSDGSPFVITAESAVQDPRNIRHARLFNVEADLSAKDGAWYNMKATRGFLDSDSRKLWLSGQLSLYSDSGYELHTDAALVDLAPSCDPKTGKAIVTRAVNHNKKSPPPCAITTVRGNREVTGQGPFGTLRADRFHVEKATKHVFLDGNVRMVLYPARGSNASGIAKKT